MNLNRSLFAPNEHVLCAVSGGADSMALLCLLLKVREELSVTVAAAHFNHRLRGAESDRDEAFVRDFCQAHGIELTVGTADVKAYAEANGKSIEEAARILRYDFLTGLPCDKIAVAHNADDNAETVLLHLLRGSGLRGLCGIAPMRGKIVRPLLHVSHAELEQFLRAEGIAWVEDSTNTNTDYARNRIRHEIMPLLKKENPNLLNTLRSQSALLRKDDELLDSQAQALVDAARQDGFYRCDVLNTAPDALQKRALRIILRKHLPQDVTLRHIESIQSLLVNPSPSAQLSLPHGLTMRRRYGLFEITADLQEKNFLPTRLNIPGETEIPSLGVKINCKITKNLQIISNNPFHFAIRYDMIAPHEVYARPRQVGDALTLSCRKRLKKWFIERKLPACERERAIVLSCGEAVVAVPILGVDRAYRPSVGEDALLISIEPMPNL